MDNSSQLIKNRVTGTEVSDFYETVCPKLNLPRVAAKKILVWLQQEGFIEIRWQSPHGARYYLRRRM